MRFSVIIPAYNADRYLRECLNSVELQTFGDFEVIAVDDGSCDGTGHMLDEFSRKMGNVTVLHGENQGPLLARRRGLLHAKGEYVVFLDADDTLRVNALETISRTIDECGADIISFNVSRKADFAVMEKSLAFDPGLYEGKNYELVKKQVCRGRFNSLCGKAIRLCRIDVNAAYGAFKGLMHGEDLFQLLPIVDACESLAHIQDILYFYRLNDASSTARYKPSQLRDIVRVDQRLFEYAGRWGGDCLVDAVKGEANQYFYLVKISELSGAGSFEKRLNFESIRNTMLDEGVFERLRGSGIRLDNRALALFIKCGWYGCARAVILAVEALKR